MHQFSKFFTDIHIYALELPEGADRPQMNTFKDCEGLSGIASMDVNGCVELGDILLCSSSPGGGGAIC